MVTVTLDDVLPEIQREMGQLRAENLLLRVALAKLQAVQTVTEAPPDGEAEPNPDGLE